jgi:teichoic acid transport system ATP-binding protein
MIEVRDLWKTFRLYQDPKDRLKEILLRRSYAREHHALQGVSFSLGPGETLGIIGENGAGKSTLLKILTGILRPTRGEVLATGHITGLLELGTGFNPELSGRSNIYLNGMLIGMDRDEVDQKLARIIDFTELGECIDDPIKTYSSGMLMRLAFAIAIHAEPRAFLVDEALSVGDAYFQQKCMRRIVEFKESGGAIIFISHDMNAVKTLCTKALVLEQGRVVEAGTPGEMVDLYMSMMLRKSHQGDFDLALDRDRQGDDSGTVGIASGAATLLATRLYDARGEEVEAVESESEVTIEFTVRCDRDLDDPLYGFYLRNRFGVSVFDTHSTCMGQKMAPLRAGDTVRVRFRITCNLFPADYSISFGCANRAVGQYDFEETVLWKHNVRIMKVLRNDRAILYSGCTNLHPTLEVASA